MRLQRRQQRVHQIVLQAIELVSDEGDHVEVAIRICTPCELEDFRSEDAARIVAHPFPAQIEGGQDIGQLVMHLLEVIEIGRALPDFAHLCRLRQLFEQGQTVMARAPGFRVFIGRGLHEQTVQMLAQRVGHALFDPPRQPPPALLKGRRDQRREAVFARQLHPFPDHQVQAAPEDQPRFEMRRGHGGDLARKKCLGPRVEPAVSVKAQDETFMSLARPCGIITSVERRRNIEQVRCAPDVRRVIGPGREEPLRSAEIGAADQKTDLVCGPS